MRKIEYTDAEALFQPFLEAAGLGDIDVKYIVDFKVEPGHHYIDITVLDPDGQPFDKITRRIFWSVSKGEAE